MTTVYIEDHEPGATYLIDTATADAPEPGATMTDMQMADVRIRPVERTPAKVTWRVVTEISDTELTVPSGLGAGVLADCAAAHAEVADAVAKA